jgi:hypothetical protein
MAQMSNFVQVPDVALRFGLWQYTGGTIRFSQGKMYVQVNTQKVDKADKK